MTAEEMRTFADIILANERERQAEVVLLRDQNDALWMRLEEAKTELDCFRPQAWESMAYRIEHPDGTAEIRLRMPCPQCGFEGPVTGENRPGGEDQ